MSLGNVEIVKRAIDAYNRRDVDAMSQVVTPAFEMVPALPGAVEGSGYRGRKGIETYFGEIRNTWEDLRIVGDEFRDLGERVLFLGRVEGRGVGSGVPVEAPVGLVFELRDGRASRSRGYLDHGEALRAAGLTE